MIPASHHAQQVWIEAGCPHRFRIVPIGRGTRWFTERGFVRRPLSLDRDFDARWTLETDDVEFGEALLRQPATRAAVRALEALGGTWITQSPKRLAVVMGAGQRGKLRQPEHKRALQTHLRELHEQSREVLESRSFPQRPGMARLFVGVMAGTAALFILSLAATVQWSRELVDGELAELALPTLLATAPIALAVLAAAIVPFAGRSTSHKELAGMAMLLPAAVMLACLSGVLAANRSLDTGPATRITVPVLEVERRLNEKRITGYWAIVPDWNADAASAPDAVHGGDDGRKRIALGVQAGSTLVPGSSELELLLSPGRLQAERLLEVVITNGQAH